MFPFGGIACSVSLENEIKLPLACSTYLQA
jgi:hypothetical protein